MGCVNATPNPSRAISPSRGSTAHSPKLLSFQSNLSRLTDSKDRSYTAALAAYNDSDLVVNPKRKKKKTQNPSQISPGRISTPSSSQFNPLQTSLISTAALTNSDKKIFSPHSVFSPRGSLDKSSFVGLAFTKHSIFNSEVDKTLLKANESQDISPQKTAGIRENLHRMERRRPSALITAREPLDVLEPAEVKDHTNPISPPKNSTISQNEKTETDNAHPVIPVPSPQRSSPLKRASKSLVPSIKLAAILTNSFQTEEDEKATPQKEKTVGIIKTSLKPQIQSKFTTNLVDLVIPKKRSPEKRALSFPSKKGENIVSLLSEPAPSQFKKIQQAASPPHDSQKATAQLDNSILLNVPLDVSPKVAAPEPLKDNFLKIQGLDVSILDRGEEDSYEVGADGRTNRKYIPHTPVRKSLFALFPEDASEKNFDNMVSRPNLNSQSILQSRILDTFKKKEETKRSNTMFEQFNTKYEGSNSPMSSVVETRTLDRSVTMDGQKQINQYILDSELGRGSYGKVKLGIHCEDYTQFAIKIAGKEKLKKKLLNREKSVYSQLEGEVAVMKKMCHPNIVQLYEVIDDPSADNLYLVMELVQRGAVMSKQYWKAEHQSQLQDSTSPKTFNEYTQANDDSIEDYEGRTLTEDKARKYFRDLVLGLDFMHNFANVIHRDIKPENLLIDNNDRLKISDFNVSHILGNINSSNVAKNGVGTKTYLAPEAWMSGQLRGQPLDVWAAGITLYYFLYARTPFASARASDLKERILNNEPEFPDEISVSDGAIELIKKCLIKDPDQRITLKDIMNDEWLTEGGKVVVSNDGMGRVNIEMKDIMNALTIKLKSTFVVAVGIKRMVNSARKRLEKQSTMDLGTPTAGEI